jgi:hypothetical protein
MGTISENAPAIKGYFPSLQILEEKPTCDAIDCRKLANTETGHEVSTQTSH